MYPCSFCVQSFDTRPEVLSHLRDRHGAQALKIQCPFCDREYGYNAYRKHLREKHDPPSTVAQQNDLNDIGPENQNFFDADVDLEEIPLDNPLEGENEDDNDEPMIPENEDDNDEPVIPLLDVPDEEIYDPELTPKEALKAKANAFGEKCFEKWLQFSSHPDATEKSASFCCSLMWEAAMDAVKCCEPLMDPEALEHVRNALKSAFAPVSTDYLRKKYLKDHGLCVPAEKIVIDYEHNTTATAEGLQMNERKQEIAAPSIRKTLLALFDNQEIVDAMIMPSDVENDAVWSHPLCGLRSKEVKQALGEDFLAIQLFMDELTTTCPIGTTATVYKMTAFYIRVLNFPVDLLSKLDHIFLGFLGHSADVMGDFQQQIGKVLMPELKNLEREGITINYHGTRRNLKVILLTLAGDNLGLHQLGALTQSFSGNNPCRMCNVTAQNLKGKFQLPGDGRKTVEWYNQIITRGTSEEMAANGIRSACVFNELQYFHFFENATVDIMHDLLEGHFQRVIPLVVRDAIAQGYSLQRINYAIKDFGYLGKDKENQIPTIFLPPRTPETGDVYKSTANEMSILIKLLPLIFHQAGIILNTRTWQMFMKLQRIIDILWSSKIDDATTEMFDQLWKNYLKEFHECGGNMTVKAHLPLHYADVIRGMGPLRVLSSIRFEAKHRDLKQRAKVSRCHKNVPMTLASKCTIMFAYSLYRMRKGNYLKALRESRAQGKYRRGLAVAYGQNATTKEPIFGEIESLLSNKILNLKVLQIEEFDARTHCFVVHGTSESLQIPLESLVCSESFPIYRRNKRYIRLMLNIK